MRGNISRVWLLVAVAGLALPVAGQVARSRTSATAETHVRAAKTPYTAEYTITHVQALADGTIITGELTEVKALDAQGRQMTATTTTSGQTQTTHVSVYDPVARTQATWHSPGKIANVFTMSAAGAQHTCERGERDDVTVVSGPKSKMTSEGLGTASIQGVESRGRRYTTTIPAGAAGNDAPLVSTSEIWTALAVGLNGLLVRDVRDDPRSGKTTKELTNLSQSDPDPATFQPPDGYEIVTKESSGCQGENTLGIATSATSGAQVRSTSEATSPK
jgi:hypothetical protein